MNVITKFAFVSVNIDKMRSMFDTESIDFYQADLYTPKGVEKVTAFKICAEKVDEILQIAKRIQQKNGKRIFLGISQENSETEGFELPSGVKKVKTKYLRVDVQPTSEIIHDCKKGEFLVVKDDVRYSIISVSYPEKMEGWFENTAQSAVFPNKILKFKLEDIEYYIIE